MAVVTLWELLSTLLGDTMKGGVPRLRELKTWATHVRLNFSHFIQGNNLIEKAVSLDCLADLWCRGAAVQCAFNQSVLDGFLVGYCGELDEVFDKKRLIMIPWQTKRQKAGANTAVVNGLVCPFIFDGKNYYKPETHLVLFMDLGTFTSFSSSRDGLLDDVVELSRCQAVRSKEWAGYHADSTKEAYRFCLNIRGHSGEEMGEHAATLLVHWKGSLAQHKVLKGG